MLALLGGLEALLILTLRVGGAETISHIFLLK